LKTILFWCTQNWRCVHFSSLNLTRAQQKSHTWNWVTSGDPELQYGDMEIHPLIWNQFGFTVLKIGMAPIFLAWIVKSHIWNEIALFDQRVNLSFRATWKESSYLENNCGFLKISAALISLAWTYQRILKSCKWNWIASVDQEVNASHKDRQKKGIFVRCRRTYVPSV
jgi:hypothetical protein